MVTIARRKLFKIVEWHNYCPLFRGYHRANSYEEAVKLMTQPSKRINIARFRKIIKTGAYFTVEDVDSRAGARYFEILEP